MASIKCRQCGLVNFASAPECKKCGAQLAHPSAAAATSADGNAINLISTGGLPGGVKGALIFVTACLVCALTISWIKPFLPEGHYLVIFFLPFAFVGYLAGLIVANLINAAYKILSPQPDR